MSSEDNAKLVSILGNAVDLAAYKIDDDSLLNISYIEK